MKQTLKIQDLRNANLSYNENIFLTFDIDWASDEVLNYCLDIIEEHDLCATFFVTHETPVLNRMRENKNIELGIHPNFNFLLNGDHRYGKNYMEVIDFYLKMVPDATSVRSHSLVQGSQILDGFKSRNLEFDLNLLIPRNSNIVLKPIKSWQEGLTRVPHFWEDDIHILYKDNPDVKFYLDFPGLKVFDFHPIHIFLNTEDLSRYNSARPFLQNHPTLIQHVNKEKDGTRTFMDKLIEEIKNEN